MIGNIKVTKTLAAAFILSDVNADNGKALVNWNVNQGNNLSYFSIQRSVDGENFKEVAKINSSGVNNYKFADASDLTEKYYYYQVEMVDKGGNSQLSGIKMFTNPKNISKLLHALVQIR